MTIPSLDKCCGSTSEIFAICSGSTIHELVKVTSPGLGRVGSFGSVSSIQSLLREFGPESGMRNLDDVSANFVRRSGPKAHLYI